MLNYDPQKKEMSSFVPPSSVTREIQQKKTSNVSYPDATPTVKLSKHSGRLQEATSDSTEPPPENALENASEEGQEQHIETEQNPKTDSTDDQTASTEKTDPATSPFPDQQQIEENTREGKIQVSTAAISSFPSGEKKSRDIARAIRQKEGQNTSDPSCKDVSPLLTNFVNRLESKEYSKKKSKGKRSAQPLQEHFNALATQLVNNPPVVIHETDELYTILTNTAHFFRVLGKDNMPLLQKVLKQETADFENIAAEIYRLSTTEETIEKQCVSGNKTLKIPFTAAYEYAGFFINTLGGRSYLFRRDTGTRLLVNYYAVLILDQANKKHLNSYGLDIREQLPWLIQEMEANNRLTNKEKYLDKLYELAEKYQALP